MHVATRRDPPDESTVAPYLDVLSRTEALVTPPPEARSRPPPVKHTFTRIFQPQDDRRAAQSEFFSDTTLPLVSDLLDGANGLIFTYGVTNSGKTYTVQGSNRAGEAGILPRALSVVFNSIRGLECNKAPGVSVPVSSFLRDGVRHPITVDEPRIAVDERFRYSVWLSCAEVYNDKLYDLLGAPGSLLDENMRRPLVLKSEGDGGKYIYGLKELKLPSLGDALELVRRAKENRRVFGTGVNRQSSRSHCVFTIKVIRELETNSDERKYYISRLSIVDLAGSERIANTGLTGERLKEAGSINKSLMCLGQCLETMRKNQRRHDKRRQSIVPFRHSKLTELFQSYFQGDGRVVMIVNVDPYGTGYEENVGVMRFSALAKNVGVNTSAVQGPSHTERVSDSESETPVDESDDGESEDEFVAALVDENERLRRRCERAEHLCTIIEATVRDEMMRHMEESIQQVKALYEAQLRDEIADNEEFTDRKIDLFARMSGTNDTRDTRDTREHSVDSIPRTPEPGNASGADASAAADASVDNSHATVIITDTPPRSQVKCVCADRLAHRAVADITDQFAELSTGPRRSARLS